MWNITVSLVTVYLGFYLFIVFLSLSIACGLYYVAELIEEYTITTKRLLGYTIKAELLLHLVLLIDKLPVLCVLGGLASHAAYLRLLKRFPYISLTSKDGLLSTVCFLASLGLWVRHYYHSYYTVEYILAFLLSTTLLVPFILFLSMAGEQAVLPGAGGYPYMAGAAAAGSRGALGPGAPAAGGSGDGPGRQQQRRSLALRLFDVLRRKRDAVLPEVTSRLPANTGLWKEKI